MLYVCNFKTTKVQIKFPHHLFTAKGSLKKKKKKNAKILCYNYKENKEKEEKDCNYVILTEINLNSERMLKF